MLVVMFAVGVGDVASDAGDCGGSGVEEAGVVRQMVAGDGGNGGDDWMVMDGDGGSDAGCDDGGGD